MAPVVGGEHNADIMILSSAIGSGHMRASAAVVRGVALLDSEKTCSIVDFPHEVSPDIEHLLRSAYLKSLKLSPAAYGQIYRSSESKTQPSSYRYIVERAGLKTLEQLVVSTRARTLVAPHFYGAGVLGGYKERNPRASAAVVLTDYVPNAILGGTP
jgi:processive 1,2-diacylglycerol beta-glucosyltransferase